MEITFNKEYLSTPTHPFNDEELISIAQNKEMQKVFNEMLKTMKENQGIGLAANQVRNNRSVCIIKHKPLDLVLLNPVIIFASKQRIIKKNEGCLSIPGERYNTLRHKEITVVARTRWGGRIKFEKVHGDLAWILQHEIDHLNGELFLERISDVSVD